MVQTSSSIMMQGYYKMQTNCSILRLLLQEERREMEFTPWLPSFQCIPPGKGVGQLLATNLTQQEWEKMHNSESHPSGRRDRSGACTQCPGISVHTHREKGQVAFRSWHSSLKLGERTKHIIFSFKRNEKK